MLIQLLLPQLQLQIFLILEPLNQIKRIAIGEDKKFFRITVQGGGCSGFKYNFGFDSKANDDDVIFDKAIIDKSSLEIISGSEVDLLQSLK